MTKSISIRSIRAKHFMNSAFKTFSLADCIRSIPAIDGLKPSQRKAIFGTHQRGENAGLLQVQRLASLIAACLVGHTKVTLSDNSQVTIEEMANRFKNGEQFTVLSYDEDAEQFVPAPVENAFMTKMATELVDIAIEDGSVLSVTPDHLVLTNRGWVEAAKLTQDDELISI